MTPASGLIRRTEGRVLRLTLNRPETHNALDFATCRALVEGIEDAMHDDAIGAVLVDALGPSFCSGMNLDELFSPEAKQLSHVHEQLFTEAARATKPLVAAVQGPAFAAGVGLVANAHVALASEDARFALSEIRIGLFPYVVFRALAMAVGERRAVELCLTGRQVDAREAERLGLVHAVCPADALAERAAEVARGLAESSLDAVRSGLLFVAETRGKSLMEAGRTAFRFREEQFRSPDFAEGVRAFREKRAPRWPSLVE